MDHLLILWRIYQSKLGILDMSNDLKVICGRVGYPGWTLIYPYGETISVVWLYCNIMLNEEVDQLAAIPHLDHFDHFVRDHRTQRHERKHKKEYLMMTNTQKHLLFILFSTHVCVCMCLEYFRIIRPYLSRD